MLNRISLGWHWMEGVLNAIIDETNKNCPIGSGTITADQSPNGTVLRAVGQNNQQPPSGGGGAQQPIKGWLTFKWQDVAWTQVTVVDPATCAQSILTVLAQSQGKSISFPLYVDTTNIDTGTPFSGSGSTLS